MVWAELVSMLTNSNLPDCQFSFIALLQKESAPVYRNLLCERVDASSAAPISAHVLLRFRARCGQGKNAYPSGGSQCGSHTQAVLLHRKTAADNPDPLRKASHSLERSR